MAKSVRALWVMTGLAFGFFGCAEAPHPERMTVSPTSFVTTAHRPVRIEPVAGGTPTAPLGIATLGNVEFHQALVTSLTNSRIFQTVTETDPAAWTLRATIVSQEMRGVWQNTAELMVRYNLMDASGNALWDDTIYTNKQMGPGEMFSGQERARGLIESAARDNISNALQHMRTRLGSAPETQSGKAP